MSASDKAKRIRYSGDVELHLPFERDFGARPSANLLREASAWFEEAKDRVNKTPAIPIPSPAPAWTDSSPRGAARCSKSIAPSPPARTATKVEWATGSKLETVHELAPIQFEAPLIRQPRTLLSIVGLALSTLAVILFATVPPPVPSSVTDLHRFALFTTIAALLSILSHALWYVLKRPAIDPAFPYCFSLATARIESWRTAYTRVAELALHCLLLLFLGIVTALSWLQVSTWCQGATGGGGGCTTQVRAAGTFAGMLAVVVAVALACKGKEALAR
ncbi:hypothetical protein BC832DRAFT_563930 [Gaertneriomyces semiglobifer]|nr:hypothetical protein BC832DRAFT_563930 [Gaertneriomyces semiglobifer]